MDPLTQHLTRLLVAANALTTDRAKETAEGIAKIAADSIEELLASEGRTAVVPAAPVPAINIPVTQNRPGPVNPLAVAGIGGFAQLDDDLDIEDDELQELDRSTALLFTVIPTDGNDVDEDLTAQAIAALTAPAAARFGAGFELTTGARGNTVKARATTVDGTPLNGLGAGTVVYTGAVVIGGRHLTVAATIAGDIDEDEEIERPLINLAVTVTANGEPAPAGLVTGAIRQVLPAIVEKIGAYDLDGTSVDGTGATLTALLPADFPIEALPNGTVVFSGDAVVNGQAVLVEARIPGDIDPENPPLDPNTFANETIAAFEAETGIEVPPVRGIRLVFTRDGGLPLTEQDVRGPAGARPLDTPLGRALMGLQRFGAVTVDDIQGGFEPSQQVALISLGDNGALRTATLRAGGLFSGKLEFAGLGWIDATAEVYDAV